MQWTDIQIRLPVEQCERAAAIAQLAAPLGIYIEDYTDLEAQVREIAHIDLIDEALLEKNRSEAIIHLYISPDQNPAEALAFLEHRLAADGLAFALETHGVNQEDWANAWKAHYHPVAIGRRLVVCPSWEDYTPEGDQLVLRLDPGMAFGTGTHHTTQLCMELLENLVTPGCHLLDMGCGSGILSLAALALGAEAAVGVDIDPTAQRTSAENAHAVGLADRFTPLCGNLVVDPTLGGALQSGSFDIIAANIVADVIIALAPHCKGLLKPGGALVVSGIIEPRAEEVLAALKQAGFTLQERRDKGGWVAAVVV